MCFLFRTVLGSTHCGPVHVTLSYISHTMKTLSVRIPEDLNEQELLMELASMLFGKGMMTPEQAAEMMGLGKAAFSKAMLSRMESDSGLKPMTLTELNDRTDRSMADSAAGRLTSSTELKAEMKRWR
jgi:hypothetical protein